MPRRDPVSIFWGPHRSFEDLAQWPATIEMHLQLFGLQPGDLTTPPLPSILFTPKILTPTDTPGRWLIVAFPFAFTLIHTTLERSLSVLRIIDTQPVFNLIVPFAVNVWAYNLLTDPAGVFAFNGSATLSWKEP